MKQLQRTLSVLLIRSSILCAAALLAAGCASHKPIATDWGAAAKVVRLNGSARYVTGSNAGRLLKVGDIIKPGVLLQTAAKSDVELVLRHGGPSSQRGGEQNTVRMWENSLLGIDRLSASETNTMTETQLDLKAGSIHGAVNVANGSRYEVKLPQGIAGIREAVYDLSAQGVVQVSSGSVVLAYVRPDRGIETQLVAESQRFDARTRSLGPPSSEISSSSKQF